MKHSNITKEKQLFVTIMMFFCLAFYTVSCQNSDLNPSKDSRKKSNQKELNSNNNMDTIQPLKLTDEEWKQKLSAEQYNILRQKGTERPYTGKYNAHFDNGNYVCAGCGLELFSSSNKFESHCGWPSFDGEFKKGNITTQTDYSHGMVRTEIMCTRCGGHLGHLFDDGPTKSGLRYCVNSVSIDFKSEK